MKQKITPEQEKGAHGACATIKVVAEKTKEAPVGFVVINESDFDPEVHELAKGESLSTDEPKAHAVRSRKTAASK